MHQKLLQGCFHTSSCLFRKTSRKHSESSYRYFLKKSTRDWFRKCSLDSMKNLAVLCQGMLPSFPGFFFDIYSRENCKNLFTDSLEINSEILTKPFYRNSVRNISRNFGGFFSEICPPNALGIIWENSPRFLSKDSSENFLQNSRINFSTYSIKDLSRSFFIFFFRNCFWIPSRIFPGFLQLFL